MTDKQQPEALRQAAWLKREGASCQRHYDLGVLIERQYAELETLRAKLMTYEDLGDAVSDVQLLRMGYAAARLEIESMRAAQPAGAQQPGAAYAALSDVDSLAQEIRRVDGSHRLGAGALAEALMPFLRASHGQAPAQAAPVCGPPADLPPLPDPDLRDVGTTPGGIKEFLRGYATEYAKAALAARAPADSVLEDAAQVEIDLFNDLNRIYGNTLTAYAKELCRLGYRKTNAARKQGANHD